MGEFDEISYSKASKNTTQLAELSQEVATKRDIATPLEQTDLSDTLKAQIAGTAGILSTPEDASVTREKIDKAIISANLFDADKAIYNMQLTYTTGAESSSTSKNVSGYCIVKPSTVYVFANVKGYCFYDVNKDYISGVEIAGLGESNCQVTSPANAVYVRYYYYRTSIADTAQMLTEGSEIPTSYIPYTFKVPHLKVDLSNLNFDIAEAVSSEGNVLVGSLYWSDFTFVGDDIWAFNPTDDTSGIGYLYIYAFNGSDYTLSKRLTHNFGHCNTVDYCNTTETLIFGNGSGIHDTDGYIYIMQGISQWEALATDTLLDMVNGITGTDIITISVARLFGDKVNVCWGEDNYDQYNICYVMSNDNKNFRKLLLGKGANNMGAGQLVAEKTATQFNGTYKVLGEWTTAKIEVNQGTCYYNGYIYSTLGHDGLWLARYKLNTDGTISVEQKRENYYAVDGTELDVASEGVAVKNGMIYHSTKIDVAAVHVYRAF